MSYARIAVPRPLRRTFHYHVPDRFRAWVQPGVRCVVSFGRSRVAGFVISLDDVPDVSPTKEVIEVLDPEPCLPPDLLALGLWLSSYYHHPPGETLSALLPPASRVSSQPVYRWRGAGPVEFPAGTAEARLLERVKTRGEVPVSGMAASELRALACLANAGCVERAWRVEPPSSPWEEEWFELTGDSPSPDGMPRAPRQAEVLRALASGPLPAQIFRARGVPRSALLRTVERGWVKRWKQTPAAPPGVVQESVRLRPNLTPEQTNAVTAVVQGLEQEVFTPILLQGVTGSGKTEVYVRAVEEARKRGKGAVILVPEISLTAQMLGRFLAAFGEEVAVLHSGLSKRERAVQWDRVRRGEAPVAIGARSAVFAPVACLGLVVVDEEHEATYKQEDGLRYNAKHAALVRARSCGAAVLLGSATPDVETFWAARLGRYHRTVLPKRVLSAKPPIVQVVDLRQEERRRRRRVLLSAPLRRAVDTALDRGEQVLLFLNRRGFSPALLCSSCGEACSCRRCSIAMTLHHRAAQTGLVCHYCGSRRPSPPACPACGAAGLVPAGAGTQKLENLVEQAWPGARVVRLDKDTARRSGGEEVLGAFHRGDADILVGTQMVAKGHHFPRLTVVGVVDADLSLHFPDFRAAERTFQVLTQVAGRAGREDMPGRAFLQTRNPHHPIIAAAARGDYEAFAETELAARREAGFPPFRRLGLLVISSASEAEARRTAAEAAEEARRQGARLGVEVLGPASAPIERIRNRWRFQVLLRGPGPEPGPLQAAIRRMIGWRDAGMRSGTRFHVDVDPVSLL